MAAAEEIAMNPHAHLTGSRAGLSAAAYRERAIALAPDALELLANDHQQIRELIARCRELSARGAPSAERLQATGLLCTLLTVHDAIEEQILYPMARQSPLLRETVDSSLADHAMIKHLVRRLQATRPSNRNHDELAAELSEWVEAHIASEEQGLFERLRDSGLDLEALGYALGCRQEALLGGEPEDRMVVDRRRS
jgi:hemerythrin superfamily protein